MNTSVVLFHLIERRDEMKKIRLDHLKQDQEMQEIPTITGGDPRYIRGPPDVVFDGAFGGVGDEKVIVGECVVVTSSSLEMLINSFLEGIMVSLIFLEGFEEEALVEFMVELFEEDDKKSKKYDLFN
nr:hypothetical protein [Tanacetum cinerariifolium]